VYGQLKLPHHPQFNGDFNQHAYASSLQTWGQLRVKQLTQLQTNPSWQDTLHNQIRLWQTRTQAYYKEALSRWHLSLDANTTALTQAELLGSMVLGNRASPLNDTLNTAFLHTGQTHLIAASGMNIAIIAGGMWWLTRFLPVPVWLQLPWILLAVYAYCCMTGWPPSIKRAGMVWMLALCLRPLLPASTPSLWLLMGVVAIACLEPACLLSLGFQLSVATTFGLMQWFTWIESRLQHSPWPTWLWHSAVASAVAQWWALPLLLFVFQYMPLHSILWNAVSTLAVIPITLLGFTGMSLSLLPEGGLWSPFNWLRQGCIQLASPWLEGLIQWTLLGGRLHDALPWLAYYTLAPSTVWGCLIGGWLLLPSLLHAFNLTWPTQKRQQLQAFSLMALYGVMGGLLLVSLSPTLRTVALPAPYNRVLHTLQQPQPASLSWLKQESAVPSRPTEIHTLTLTHWPNKSEINTLLQWLKRANILAEAHHGTPWMLRIQQPTNASLPTARRRTPLIEALNSLPPSVATQLDLCLPKQSRQIPHLREQFQHIGWVHQDC
jgi:ComEC/Rec2-related protein